MKIKVLFKAKLRGVEKDFGLGPGVVEKQEVVYSVNKNHHESLFRHQVEGDAREYALRVLEVQTEIQPTRKTNAEVKSKRTRNKGSVQPATGRAGQTSRPKPRKAAGNR